MKTRRSICRWTVVGLLAVFAAAAPGALADSDKPIARILDPWKGYDEFTFKSAGDQILFAEIRSEVYQTQGRHGGEHGGTTESCTDDTAGGCSGDTGTGGCSDGTHDDGGCTDGTHDDGGCSGGGGPGDLCLQVIDPDGLLICWAGRPMRPGWQRDPRLACPIPWGYDDRDFTLRVRRGGCGNANPPAETTVAEPETIYILSVRLMNNASEGNLQPAMAWGSKD